MSVIINTQISDDCLPPSVITAVEVLVAFEVTAWDSMQVSEWLNREA